MIDWNEARKQISIHPGKINLNAGTLSPTPLPVLDRVTELRREQAASPSNFQWRVGPALIQKSHTALGSYLNCRPDELALLPNVTFAINLVANSLKLPPGSEILTSDHEYGAMLFTLRRLAKRDGLSVREIAIPYTSEDPAAFVEAFRRQLTDKTRVLFFSHVTASTGLALPAEQLCALARERGIISVIDGAHAPGNIPVDLQRIGADFYGANCHKWMMAPANCGFLHVRRELRAGVQALVTSWGHGYDPAKQDETPDGSTFWQKDLEFHGTTDRTAQMVLPELFRFRESLGGEESIRARSRELVTYTRQKLQPLGVTPVTPANTMLSGSLIAFDPGKADTKVMGARLWPEFGIECPVTGAAGKQFIRVSAAWFVLKEEIDALAAALAQF